MKQTLIALTAVLTLIPGASEAHAAGCRACDVALEQCLAACAGLEASSSDQVACLVRCDNAAAECSACDERVSLRSEDLVDAKAIQRAATAVCHSTTPCGSAYPSCASWSGYYDCGSPFCGTFKYCGDPCELCLTVGSPEPNPPPCPCPGPALQQRRERYRVCFNALGQSCTEYQRIVMTLGCGC